MRTLIPQRGYRRHQDYRLTLSKFTTRRSGDNCVALRGTNVRDGSKADKRQELLKVLQCLRPGNKRGGEVASPAGVALRLKPESIEADHQTRDQVTCSAHFRRRTGAEGNHGFAGCDLGTALSSQALVDGGMSSGATATEKTSPSRCAKVPSSRTWAPSVLTSLRSGEGKPWTSIGYPRAAMHCRNCAAVGQLSAGNAT